MNSKKTPYSLQLCVAALFTLAAAAHATYFDLGRIILQPSDEVGYMQRGLHNMGEQNQWNVYSFPLHSLTYAFTSLFEADPIRIFQLNGIVPFFLVIFLLQALVIRHTRQPLIAVIVCAPLLLSSKIGMLAWPHANQTACIVLLTGLLLLPRVPGPNRLAAHFTTLTFAAAFARSEFALALYAVIAVSVALAAARCIRHPKQWLAPLSSFLLPVAVVIAGLTMALGRPIFLDRYRSWAAFTQHFSYSLSLRTHLDEDPWTRNNEIAARYFGKATTLGQAFVANPAEFVGHIWHNFRQMVDWLLSSDAPAALGMAIVVSWYVATLLKYGLSFFGLLRAGRIPAQRFRRLLTLLLPLPALLLIVVIFPRPNYLQLVYVLCAACLVATLGDQWRRYWINRIPQIRAAPWALALGALIIGLIKPIPQQPDPVLAVVRMVNSAPPTADAAQEWTLISNIDGICAFVRPQCGQITLGDLPAAQFSARLDDKQTALIVVDGSGLRYLPEETLRLLQSFEADPESHGWQRIRDLPIAWQLYRKTAGPAGPLH